MQDVQFVGGGEPGANLAGNFNRAIRREPPDAAQQRRQIFPIDVLHRQEDAIVRFTDVVDAANVAMRDLARGANFVVELRQPRRILRDRFRQKLERDRLSQA